MINRLIIKLICTAAVFIACSTTLFAQDMPVFNHLPALPSKDGFAGMYAGVSNGTLFCMGGANFPDKKPWEGGAKKWYADIYMLRDGKEWVKIDQSLTMPSGYGVSVSYKNSIIIAGGSISTTQHSAKVNAYKWNGAAMEITAYPNLPIPLANMAGTLAGHLIIIAGGINTPTSEALKKCYALDLENTRAGWFELPPFPGSGRNLPVCAASNGKFYLFGGETVKVTGQGNKRYILQDAYSFTLRKANGHWTGIWKTLAPMPKGVSAAGSPLPVLKNGNIVFWGGVDAATALHTDPVTHPGIPQDIFLYSPAKNKWQYAGKQTDIPARVTLPIVLWNHQWVYINGEVRPGIRTNTVCAINE